MLNHILRLLFVLPIIILLVGVVTVNIRLNYIPPIEVVKGDTLNTDLLKELRGLKSTLYEGADIDMQKIYPEGYLFINALYGLAWCNFLETTKSKPSIYFKEGHDEIQNAWNKINSEIGRAPFNQELSLAFGAFYTGWSTYVLGKKLKIEQPTNRNEIDVALFKQQCERIDSAIHEKIYPVSYYGAAWPADAVVCIAALSLHDQIFPAKYNSSIKNWVTKVKATLDPYGLIPHAVDPLNNEPIETARGSSQSLMLIFLKDIDQEFASQQFKIYQANFLDSKLGVSGIREYPKDDDGFGDIDSGPVIFELGSASTIVGMYTLHLYGEHKAAAEIRSMIEAFGFPFQNEESKEYLFGLLPMADAFIAWGHSTTGTKSFDTDFTNFKQYSLVIVLILILMLWFLFKPKRASSAKSLHIPW